MFAEPVWPRVRRSLRALLPWLMLCGAVLSFNAHADSPRVKTYDYYAIGDVHAPTPGKTSTGLMLMGGGDWVGKAFSWLAAKSGHGHFLILRASGGDELQQEMYHHIGGVVSVETLVFHAREAASDPAVLDIVRHADGIFLAGGDQSNYVRYWKDTPLSALLDAHVHAGKPIGGSSAGLAVLGGHVYGALDGGSLRSHEALRDPLGPGVTLVEDFLHLPYLQYVITDTHFDARQRLGRLIAFLARLQHEGATDVVGLGVDERTALCIEADGSGRVFTARNGYVWLVQPTQPPAPLVAGEPLQVKGWRVTGIGPQSHIDMRDLRVRKPAFRALADAGAGTWSLRGQVQPLLVIHGGAGVERAEMTPEREARARDALALALRRGYARLQAGDSALDAVSAAIVVLEDDPLFNAGRGAVFTHDGRNELDASIMDGPSLAAGAVANVHRVKNPVLLARAVMEKSPHVLLVGDGAEQFAAEQGIALVDPSYFRTEERWQQLQKALEEDAAGKRAATGMATLRHFGTVGAVARDSQGRLAAATSTGGMTNKRWGRVGDSPIIGAGTYANADCAVSGTGWGEYYLRVAAARDICLRMSLLGESAAVAGQTVIEDEIPSLGGDGGAIVLGADGEVAMPFNTEGMYRGWIGSDGVPHVAIYAQDALALPSPAP